MTTGEAVTFELAGATMPSPASPTNNDDYFEIGADERSFALFGGIDNADENPQSGTDYVYRAGARIAPGTLADLAKYNPAHPDRFVDLLTAELVHANELMEEDPATIDLKVSATIGVVRNAGQANTKDVWLGFIGGNTVYRWQAPKNETTIWARDKHNTTVAAEGGSELDNFLLETKFADLTSEKQLNPDEQTAWQARHEVINWLGKGTVFPEPQVTVVHKQLVPGDVMVAATPGVAKNLTLKEMSAIIKNSDGRALSVARLLVYRAAQHSINLRREIKEPADATAVVAAYRQV